MRWSDPFEQLSVGERFESGARAVHDTDVIVFCALTGDWHPQHCDPEWAAASPFGERIAHGMLVLSLAVGLVPLDPARVLALRRVSDVVFKRPVRLDDSICVAGEITSLRPIDDSSGLVDFAWRINNQDGALVARASVQVLWRAGSAVGEHEADGTDSALAQGAPESWYEPIAGGVAPGDFTPLPL
ncbi:MAG: MaoC domain protein dehydratase [Solirubrobacterales bacterium]|nr:MaoC domain protein dehydratase [Solirubrobacterales bacterium]